MTRVFVVIALLAATARADETSGEDDDPGFNLFGFRITAGALPIDQKRATAISLGLELEHPVFTKTRVLAEYAWLWLSLGDERDLTSTLPRPPHFATGHRAQLGLRRELAGKGGHSIRVFLDSELGGGMALVNDNMTGPEMIPTGFVGGRFGYDMYSAREDSPSRTFEFDMMVRALVSPDGIGFAFGLGLAWGN